MNERNTYKSIALIRHGFGGHPFGKDEGKSKKEKQAGLLKYEADFRYAK
jgi:hypothetical protein